jgi:hypothetical protein
MCKAGVGQLGVSTPSSIRAINGSEIRFEKSLR